MQASAESWVVLFSTNCGLVLYQDNESFIILRPIALSPVLLKFLFLCRSKKKPFIHKTIYINFFFFQNELENESYFIKDNKN